MRDHRHAVSHRLRRRWLERFAGELGKDLPRGLASRDAQLLRGLQNIVVDEQSRAHVWYHHASRIRCQSGCEPADS